MKVLLTGGSGLIGKLLAKKLAARGHSVRFLTRHTPKNPDEFYWNISENEIDAAAFENLDAIIHLAGAPVNGRWTAEYKKEMFASRVGATKLMLEKCREQNIRLKAFISASGINYYGSFTSDQLLTETDGIIQPDFLAKLSAAWEASAHDFSAVADRTVCLRTSMVLANEGGALPLLKKITDFYLAAPVGSGKQWVNWIHLDDMAEMYMFALENEAVAGNYNAVADGQVTNSTLMKKIAAQENKILWPVAVPAFLLKTVLGERSAVVLEGTRASNKKITDAGFEFMFTELEMALQNLL